jgi:predicted membrane channel-forming protein YqfA (hemolysin III family)
MEDLMIAAVGAATLCRRVLLAAPRTLFLLSLSFHLMPVSLKPDNAAARMDYDSIFPCQQTSPTE